MAAPSLCCLLVEWGSVEKHSSNAGLGWIVDFIGCFDSSSTCLTPVVDRELIPSVVLPLYLTSRGTQDQEKKAVGKEK